jgi:hypothetical protein
MTGRNIVLGPLLAGIDSCAARLSNGVVANDPTVLQSSSTFRINGSLKATSS